MDGHAAVTRPPAGTLPSTDPRSALASAAVNYARSRRDVGTLLVELGDHWSERAAIREYLGGLTRQQAEHVAVGDTIRYYNAKFGGQP